jgi:hypothetical protein
MGLMIKRIFVIETFYDDIFSQNLKLKILPPFSTVFPAASTSIF